MKPKCNNCGANALETYCTACGIVAEQPAPDAVLLEALRPFAVCAEMWSGADPEQMIYWAKAETGGQPLKITVGDLRAARAALASVEQAN